MSNPVAVARGESLLLWCPGCDDVHRVVTPTWTWDGNLEAPTVSPSIHVGGVQWDPTSGFHKPHHTVAPGEPTVCHSFLRAGRWEFLSDSTHHLAGQTVDMVPLPDYLAKE